MAHDPSESREIADLKAQLARLSERLGPDPDAATKAPASRVVYKKQADPDPDQVDHPGWDAKVIPETDLSSALKDGWLEKPGPYVYQKPDRKPKK